MLGNAHFEHSPFNDHVKFAQAIHLVERAARYVNENATGRDSPLPFILGGDFNAQPISSAMSVFYNEDIEKVSEDSSLSTWRIPEDFDSERKLKYIKLNEILQRKIASGQLSPLIGDLESAYQYYEPAGGPNLSDATRDKTMPVFTNYTA